MLLMLSSCFSAFANLNCSIKSVDAVKEMVAVLDIPVRQVVIEARMVTVSDNVNEELGIKWGITAAGDYLNAQCK